MDINEYNIYCGNYYLMWFNIISSLKHVINSKIEKYLLLWRKLESSTLRDETCKVTIVQTFDRDYIQSLDS